MSEALKFYLPDVALDKPSIITSYTASQAATSAGAYDSNAADVSHELLRLKLCDIDVGTNIGPEQAWRCYNKENELDVSSTVFDMPPDMWRYDWVKRDAEGEPVDLEGKLITDPNADYIIEHGATNANVSGSGMGPNDRGKHYYAGIGAKTNILNFFNTQDAALTGWEFAQLTKPDHNSGSTWDYTNTYHEKYKEYEAYEAYVDCLEINQHEDFPDEVCSVFAAEQSSMPDEAGIYQSIFQKDGNKITYNAQTRIELLSHVIPARTEPLGQEPVIKQENNNTFVEISANPEMHGFTNSNQDHSAPFHGYYSEISKKRDIPSPRQRAAYWNKVLDQSIYPLDKNNLTKLTNNIGL